jgi:hypothetical protein
MRLLTLVGLAISFALPTIAQEQNINCGVRLLA